jgi:hypothetical protein
MMTTEQIAMCVRYGVSPVESPDDFKVGIARDVRAGEVPINGLRHPPEGDTTGWYIWIGQEMSTEADFFVPLHVAHLDEWYSGVKKFLALPPGWRFLKAGDYEDVWYDETLLDTAG